MAALPGLASAQLDPDAEPEEDQKSLSGLVKYKEARALLKKQRIDLAVPESPAFTALGLNPEDITRPATPRELGSAVLTAADKQGNFQTGLAIDFAPYPLARGAKFSLADYKRDAFQRQLARTQISIATTKGTDSEDESVRLAVGARLVPWSEGDTRMDDTLLDCLREKQLPEEDDLDAYYAALDAFLPELEEHTEQCVKKAEKRLSGGSGWDLGAAPTLIQEGSSNSDLSWGGATFWSSLSLRRYDLMCKFKRDEDKKEKCEAKRADMNPSDDLQLILHSRFRLDETIANDDAPSGFVDQDSLLVGARIRTGQIDLGGRSVQLSVEGSYVWEDPEGTSSESSLRGGLGADLQIARNVWLHASLGASAGRGDDRVFAGATLKWGKRDIDLSKIVEVAGKAGEKLK